MRSPLNERGSCEAGQASIEIVALAPIVLLVAFTIALILAAFGARDAAQQAAVAGAIAQTQGRDGLAAARDSAPGWARVTVTLKDGRIVARATPRHLPEVVAQVVGATSTVVLPPGATQ